MFRLEMSRWKCWDWQNRMALLGHCSYYLPILECNTTESPPSIHQPKGQTLNQYKWRVCLWHAPFTNDKILWKFIRFCYNIPTEQPSDHGQHTYSTDQISRVWTPPIPSAHSSHPLLRNQTLVTTIEHLWPLCCVIIAFQRSIPWSNRWTTVNWSEDRKIHITHR